MSENSPGPNGPRQQTVRDVMKRPTTTIEAGAHLAACAYVMKHAHDTALVVVTDDSTHAPVSVITEADLARAVAQGRDVEDTRVRELVPDKPVAIEADAVVNDAIRLMLTEGVQHLPVLDGGRLVGVVELADLAYLYLTPGPVAVAEA